MIVLHLACFTTAALLNPDDICGVCFRTITNFITITDRGDAPKVAELVAHCQSFESAEEKRQCETILNGNYSFIVESHHNGSSAGEICAALAQCALPLGRWSRFKHNSKRLWNKNVPQRFRVNMSNSTLGKPPAQPSRSHSKADKAKETANKIVDDTVKVGKKAAKGGKALVKKAGKSKEWNSIKKNSKAAFSKAFGRGDHHPEGGDGAAGDEQ
jgi:hypothetical protein